MELRREYFEYLEAVSSSSFLRVAVYSLMVEASKLSKVLSGRGPHVESSTEEGDPIMKYITMMVCEQWITGDICGR